METFNSGYDQQVSEHSELQLAAYEAVQPQTGQSAPADVCPPQY